MYLSFYNNLNNLEKDGKKYTFDDLMHVLDLKKIENAKTVNETQFFTRSNCPHEMGNGTVVTRIFKTFRIHLKKKIFNHERTRINTNFNTFFSKQGWNVGK